MTPHAWCRDPSRDERVRADEDGRAGPLPTLEECIVAVTERMSIDAGGEESSQWLRTERITLEVTHDLDARLSDWDARLSDWIVEVVDESLGLMESVRVVEDCCIDHINMGEVLRQRDAAIRARDYARKSWLRSEESGTRFLAERNAALDAADGLRKRVAELEAASGGEQPRGWLTDEEREALRYASQGLREAGGISNVQAMKQIDDILARSTPPEVVLPKLHTRCEVNEANHKSPCLWFRRPDVLAALAAAGVAVKEVGGE